MLREGDPFTILRDPWWAYQFDSAVALVGGIIESALLETDKTAGVDGEVKHTAKYTLKQVLDPDFRLPLKEETKRQGLSWGKGYEY